jgi:hypothetical protein
MAIYILAVRHDRRGRVQTPWADLITGLPGVSLLGGTDFRTARVEVDDGALEALRTRVGEDVIVELEMHAEPCDDSARPSYGDGRWPKPPEESGSR